MKKKHRNMIHIVLNAITLTIFTWLQMMIYVVMEECFHEGMFVTIFVVSLCFVPLMWWGMFPKIK